MSLLMDIIQDEFSSLDIHNTLSSITHQTINHERLTRIMEIRRLESPDFNPPKYHDPTTPPSSPPFLSPPSSSSSSSASSSPGTTGSPPPPSPPQFPQFSLFPGEIQNLIWDHAAWLFSSPTSHLIPTRDSFALNLANLLITCRASRAAILRNNSSSPFNSERTILQTLPPPSWKSSFVPASKSVNLSLDLHRDLVCLTPATATCDEVRKMLDYTDGNHFIFTAARKFAVRYDTGWELPSPGPFQHDRRCPTGWMGMRGGGRPGFCSRCVGRLVERFGRLEEVWVVVDLPDGGGWRRVEGWGKRREFEGFDRRYFAVEGVVPVGEGQVEGKEGNGGVVEEGLEVLERVKSNLKDPRYYHMPWVSQLKFGLLGWEKL
ncbi:hypothetical protein B0T21DRAFT_387103 [Apiosordaria backusii]|uniref:Uncharacterized protein n=1 Tax=Apiosordaria backusii TaxID=314023 RepID=A0AA40AEJ4_9PEZI|nr:hypothetical protein B0T21DRAFT_387103 [Apiosordaria backusii]